METSYTFVWMSDAGYVAAIDSVGCRSDADALEVARTLFRDDEITQRWPSCRRIDAYEGERLVHQVYRSAREKVT